MASNNDWKSRLGMVYSTNPDFEFDTGQPDEPTLLPPNQQKLRAQMERAGRGGKTATVVKGFVGPETDLQALAKTLKTKLGIGGSAKDNQIILQGDVRQRTVELLKSLGYTQSK